MIEIEKLISNPGLFNDKSNRNSDDVFKAITPFMSPKIESSATKAALRMTEGSLNVPKEAFKYQAEIIIRRAVDTYFIYEKWKNNVPIIAYLMTAINRFVIKSIDKGQQYTNVSEYICPLCKEKKMKEVLEVDDDMFVCRNCSSQIETMEKELEGLKNE